LGFDFWQARKKLETTLRTRGKSSGPPSKSNRSEKHEGSRKSDYQVGFNLSCLEIEKKGGASKDFGMN